MKRQLVRFGTARAANAPNHLGPRVGSLLLCLLAAWLAGCSATKSKSEAKPVHQRGWIGGEFKLARRFVLFGIFGTQGEYVPVLPSGLAGSNRAGILITALSSNAPASQAGLREGDLILACARQPITTLRAFRRLVDQAEPGSRLPLTAWREGRTFDCNVPVGRETFQNWATFRIGITLPNLSDFGHLDLWPNSGFDLAVLGFEPPADDRKELASAECIYQRACNRGQYTPSDQDWNAWLAVFGCSREKHILSQENVPARTASPPRAGAASQ
ncbi:MAG TPA: PDZ domain-containing protein [Dongiaceae bacterium]|nr:PDZ domain-containing protein [Dongiaceae bacterium]